MTRRSRHLLAALAVTTALGAAAGCGGSDEPEGEGLPRGTVSQLETRLDEINRRYNDARDNDNPGACEDIDTDSFPAIRELLASLPDDVDPDLREAVDDSFSRLRELTSEGCAGVEPQETETETAPPETDTETIPPEPPPPQTQPERPAPETQTTPQDEGDQEDQGGGASPNQGGGASAPQGGN